MSLFLGFNDAPYTFGINISQSNINGSMVMRNVYYIYYTVAGISIAKVSKLTYSLTTVLGVIQGGPKKWHHFFGMP